MAKRNQPPKWQDVRRTLASKSQRELLNLIRDLYAQYPEVKNFINARLVASMANLKPYQKAIQEALYPDIIHGEDLDLERGQKAICDYQKATNDPMGTLDLMLHYVECGTSYATTYGYGDEEFFESLDEMFTQAVKMIKQSEQTVIDKFRHLKNSAPRIIGVSEGLRAKSTNMRHHSSSNLNPFPFSRRNRYEPKDHTRFPPPTHVFGLGGLCQPGRGLESAKPGNLHHPLSQAL
jgi:hypothetical protein